MSTAPQGISPFIGVFDLFKIGIGPSSSHTVGPMIAARRFATHLQSTDALKSISRVHVELFGSLSATGRGHATDRAVLAGLEGHTPELLEPDYFARLLEGIKANGTLTLLGDHRIAFNPVRDIIFHKHALEEHPNALRFSASIDNGLVLQRTYYSVGGGFVVEEGTATAPTCADIQIPYPFSTAADLLAYCSQNICSIASVALENERALRADSEIFAGLDRIQNAMRACIDRGLATDGLLPGGLNVRRRAAGLHRKLLEDRSGDPLSVMDWVSTFAIAVNEENACYGRVVTAPTNGAAGIVPAVLEYYVRFIPSATPSRVHNFLLTAGAIGSIIKKNASISGAEVGCQGEVGSAAAMAAAGLAEALGGTPLQVENAAEIALEHSLGLTCDPVGGLVQIPCIERNAIASVKAISSARLALKEDGKHRVSLDQVIYTLREIGRDMHHKYKETSLGGLALAVPQC